MIHNYLLIKQGRFRKKISLYNQLFQITFEPVVLFYVFAFFAYVAYAAFQYGHVPSFIPVLSDEIAVFLEGRLYFILNAVPFVFLLSSFKHPGLFYSSAEHVLTMLPYKRRQVWLLTVGERYIKICLSLGLIGFLLYVITPMSFFVLGQYIVGLFLVTSLITIVQWKLFSMRFIYKFLFIVIFLIINLSQFLWSPIYTFFLLLSSLIVYVLIVSQHLLTNIEWHKVITTVDHSIWNMPLISQATKVKFEKEGPATLWQYFKFWRRPFRFHKLHIYHRLWYIYFEKRMSLLFRFIGTLVVLLAVISFFHKWYYVVSIVFISYIQRLFLFSLFNERVESDLLAVLPWDLFRLRRSFIPWACILTIPIFIPMIVYSKIYFDIYFLFLLLAFITLFLLLLEERFANIMLTYYGVDRYYIVRQIAVILAIGLFIVGGQYPLLFLASFCVSLFGLWRYRLKSMHGEVNFT